MPRLTIRRLIAFIVLVAAHLGVLRALVSMLIEPGFLVLFFIALLPLAEAHLIGLYLLTWRFRMVIRRKDGQFVSVFVVTSALMLLATVIVSIVQPVLIPGLAELIWGTLEGHLSVLGFSEASAMVVLAILLGSAISGPPLIVAITVSLMLSRFQLVVTPREAS